MENQHLLETKEASSHAVEKLQVDASAIQNEDLDKGAKAQDIGHDGPEFDSKLDDISDAIKDGKDGRSKSDTDEDVETKSEIKVNNVGQEYSGEPKNEETNLDGNSGQNDLAKEEDGSRDKESTHTDRKEDEIPSEDNNLEPVFDGTEVPGLEVIRSTSTRRLDGDQDSPGVVEKAVALKNFVREKSAVAV